MGKSRLLHIFHRHRKVAYRSTAGRSNNIFLVIARTRRRSLGRVCWHRHRSVRGHDTVCIEITAIQTVGLFFRRRCHRLTTTERFLLPTIALFFDIVFEIASRTNEFVRILGDFDCINLTISLGRGHRLRESLFITKQHFLFGWGSLQKSIQRKQVSVISTS